MILLIMISVGIMNVLFGMDVNGRIGIVIQYNSMMFSRVRLVFFLMFDFDWGIVCFFDGD